MAVIKKPVIFACEICPRIFTNGQFLFDVILPVRLYEDDGMKFAMGQKKVSICSHCLEVFNEVVESNFAIIEVGLRGTKPFPVFDTGVSDLEEINLIGDDKGKDVKDGA